MRLRLPELQESGPEAKKLRNENLLYGWQEVEGVFQYQSFLYYILEIICSKVISHHHDNPLTDTSKSKKLESC